MAVIDTSMPLQIPKRKVIATAMTNPLGQTSLAQGLPLSGPEYDWAGRPIGNNKLLTPIFYHRGSWLALHCIDPLTVGSPFSAYWALTPGAPSITMRNTQYGTAFQTSTYSPKCPTTIMYNMLLAKAPSASGNALFTSTNYNGFAATAEGYIGNAARLVSANAFVALTDPMNWFFTGQKFLAWPFPGTAYVTIAETVNGNHYSNQTKVIDKSLIAGGNLLVLSGIYTNVSGGFRTAGQSYCFVESNGAGTLTSDDVLSTLIATDLDVLARAYPKFRRFSHYIYCWGSRTSVGSTACANAAFAHLQDVANSASAYGVTLRGLYDQAVDDISSQVATDVLAFLNSL